jgi:Glycosyl hydrolase family 20, domain 2/Glycosyl hydrolase family 20, catalytic domain
MNRRAWLRRSGAGLAGLIGARKLQGGLALPASAGDEPVVLPHPQSIVFGSRHIPLGKGTTLKVSIAPDAQAGKEAKEAARMIARELGRLTGQSELSLLASRTGFPIGLRGFAGSGMETEVEGGYRLRVTPQGAQIESRAEGFRHAAATFVQLLEQGSVLRLREVEIRDWPVFLWRAIFVEVTSGACMSRTDWKELIDRAAFLKLNAISVGLYNCWQRATAAVLDEEYFLFPSRRYPQFQTPVRTYTRQRGRWAERTALPAMVREDFLGELVAYGQERGVMVSPYFSSLGHNTLIPRLIPEISMKDAQCRPIGYGFCTTCPQTYEVLFNLYDEIIERYARPYGVTTFHVAMDEVAHTCQCPDCRVAWKGEDNFYVNHLVKIARHLKQQGMTRVLIWHDMLHRSGLINQQLEARLAAEGLAGLLTIGWWYYGAPREGYFSPRGSFGRAFFRPQIGVDAWACPSAGWDTTGMLAGSDWTANQALARLLRQGKARGAKGVISYSNHDPMFQQGYVNLSQYAWNPAPALAASQARYMRWLFGADHRRGEQALKTYRDTYGIYAGLVGTFYRRPAPPRLGQAVESLGGPGLEKTRFKQSVASLESAARALSEIETRRKDGTKAKTVAIYRVEVRRLWSLLRMALEILECTSAYDDFRSERDAATLAAFGERIKDLEQSREEHEAVLRELEEVRYAPSLPRFIPYEQKAQEDVEQFVKVFSEMERRGRRGETSFMPEIVIAGENLFATRLGMVLP